MNNRLGPHRLGVIFSDFNCYNLNQEIALLNKEGFGICTFAGLGIYYKIVMLKGITNEQIFKDINAAQYQELINFDDPSSDYSSPNGLYIPQN